MKIKITQTRSLIGRTRDQRRTVRALGLKRINDSVVKDDKPEIRGMANKVIHLVKVEEAKEATSAKPKVKVKAKKETKGGSKPA